MDTARRPCMSKKPLQVSANTAIDTGPLVRMARASSTQVGHQGQRVQATRNQENSRAPVSKAVSSASLTPMRLHTITNGLNPHSKGASNHRRRSHQAISRLRRSTTEPEARADGKAADQEPSGSQSG